MSEERISTVLANFAVALGRERTSRFIEDVRDVGLDSPIEIMMAAGLLFVMQSESGMAHRGYGPIMNYAGGGGTYETLENPMPHAFLEVRPQFGIGKYTADFFVRLKHWRGTVVEAVIECDGHDFHERTKRQAAHDKTRDRYFQSIGLLVLRYAGSEIFADPLKCANEALELIEDRAAKGVPVIA